MTSERWKEIAGFEGTYWISDTGRIRNRWGRFLKTQVINSGYERALLFRTTGRTVKLVHRAVAEAYLPNPTSLPEVNHQDTNKLNNHASNLEWSSAQANSAHARANGLCVLKPNAKAVVGTSVKDGSELQFPSQKDAEVALVGKASSAIHSCLIGRQKTAYGYVWRRA